MLAHVHLEHVGAALRELANGFRTFHLWQLDRGLVHELVTASRQWVREYRNHRSAGPDRERGERRRGCRRPAEKIHPDRVGAVHVLIDQQGHAFTGSQRLHHAAHRALAIDDMVAGCGADVLEEPVQPRVIQHAGEYANRAQLHRVSERMQLPETEVAREEQDALALGIRQPHALVAFVLGAGHHLLARERAERQQLEQHLAKMFEGGAGDGAPLVRGPVRKALFEIAQRDAPMLPVDKIKREANGRAPGVDHRLRQPPREAAHGDDRPVFDRVSHRNSAPSAPSAATDTTDAINASGGSNCTCRGTRYKANGSAKDSSRTASLSVVNTTSAPRAFRFASITATSAAVYR